MFDFLLLIAGFVLLVKGADLLVDGGASLAHRFSISQLVVGLTIVAFGSSAPEFVVSFIAALGGKTDIAFSNILGSNIANILIVLGISAMIHPLTVQKTTVWKEIPLCLLATLLVAIMANDVFLLGMTSSSINRIEGLSLLGFFLIFLSYTFSIAKSTGEMVTDVPTKVFSVSKSVIYIVLGLVGLTLGGDWIVKGASSIASQMGWTESFIGLTIVAFGTSLPELAASAVSAYKGKTDIAIGNVIGSNLFNLLWVLAMTSTVKEIPMHAAANTDILVATLACFFLFIFIQQSKNHTISKKHGAIFLISYGIYFFTLLQR